MFEHVLEKLQAPLMIEPTKLAVLLDVVMRRKGAESSMVLPDQLAYGVPFAKMQPEDLMRCGLTPAQENLYWSAPLAVKFPSREVNAAVIPVFGSLVARSSGFGGSGATSYTAIKGTIEACLSAGFNNILLHIGTPGGEASLVWELADYIHNLNTSGAARIGSYTDTSATSAGQLLQAATSMRMVHETATLGSIGVIMTLLNTEVADQQDGYAYDVYKTGSLKDLGNPHRKATEEEQTKLQAMVDSLGTRFFESMSRYTGLPAAHFQAMQAGTYRGEETIALGLSTALGNYEAAVAWLLDTNETRVKPTSHSPTKTGVKSMTDTKQPLAETLDIAAVKQEAETSLLAKVSAIQTMGAAYGASQEFINTLVQQNLPLAMAEQMFKTVAAQRTAATAITTVSVQEFAQPVEAEPAAAPTFAQRLAAIKMTSSASKGA